jgi:hypothetical protein
MEREKAESAGPAPYFTKGDIRILLKHQENIIQQDPRVFLKKCELELMSNTWRNLERQSEALRKHPNTLIQMEKKVFRWAAQGNNGHMWTYFILAALQWLPTKSRKLKGQVGKDTLCRLCLQLQEDNTSHELIEETFQRHVRSWGVVPDSTIWTDKEVRATRWARLAASHVRSKFPQHSPPAIRVNQSRLIYHCDRSIDGTYR